MKLTVRIYRNLPSHTVCYVYYPIYWLIDNPSKFIYPNHPHTIYGSSPIWTNMLSSYNHYNVPKSWKIKLTMQRKLSLLFTLSFCNARYRHCDFVLHFLLINKIHEEPSNWTYFSIYIAIRMLCYNLHYLITMCYYVTHTRSSLQWILSILCLIDISELVFDKSVISSFKN